MILLEELVLEIKMQIKKARPFHDVDNIWVNPRPMISSCLGLQLCPDCLVSPSLDVHLPINCAAILDEFLCLQDNILNRGLNHLAVISTDRYSELSLAEI
jgi:hypothetical protein